MKANAPKYDVTQLGFAFTFLLWMLQREQALLAIEIRKSKFENV